MEFANLIAEFGARYGMGDLAPDENGAVATEADAATSADASAPPSGGDPLVSMMHV